jgi:hypothetical protein
MEKIVELIVTNIGRGFPQSKNAKIEAPCSPAKAGSPLRSDKLQSAFGGFEMQGSDSILL